MAVIVVPILAPIAKAKAFSYVILLRRKSGNDDYQGRMARLHNHGSGYTDQSEKHNSGIARH